MYIRVIKDAVVVECIKDPIFVKWQRKNKMFIAAPQEESTGVVSHNGEWFWKTSEAIGPFKDVVEIEEITEQEYAEWEESQPEPQPLYTLDEAAGIITQEVSNE